MKTIIEFNLPEDREEYELAINAGKIQTLIDDLDNYLRGQIKYNEDLTDWQCDTYESIREKLHGKY